GVDVDRPEHLVLVRERHRLPTRKASDARKLAKIGIVVQVLSQRGGASFTRAVPPRRLYCHETGVIGRWSGSDRTVREATGLDLGSDDLRMVKVDTDE